MVKFNIENLKGELKILKNASIVNGTVVSGNGETKKFSQLKEGKNKIKYGRKIVELIKSGKSLSYKCEDEYFYKNVEDNTDINAKFIDESEIPVEKKKIAKKSRTISKEDDEDLEDEVEIKTSKKEETEQKVEIKQDVYKIKENIITKNSDFYVDVSKSNLLFLKDIKEIQMDPNTTAICLKAFSGGSYDLGVLVSKIKTTKGCVITKY